MTEKKKLFKTKIYRCGNSTVCQIGKIYSKTEILTAINGQKPSSVRVLQVQQFDKSPHNLFLNSVSFCKGYDPEPKNKFLFQVKNKKLNIFTLKEGFFKNVSTFPFSDFKIFTKDSQCKRFFSILKKFLKQNGINCRKNIKDITASNISKVLLRICYPTLKNIPFNEYTGLDILRFMPKKTVFKEGLGFKSFLKKTIGSSGSKTTKILLEDSHRFYDFYLYKNVLSINEIQDLKNSPIDLSKRNLPHFKKIIKFLGKEKSAKFIKRHSLSLANAIRSGREYIIRDTAELINQVGSIEIPKEIDDLFKLHDFLAKKERMATTPTKEIPYTKSESKINNLTWESDLGKFRIELPQTNHDLFHYGDKMANCINSYFDRASTKQCLVLGIFQNGELTYNVEVSNNRINQFVEKFNRPAPKEVVHEVSQKLAENEILKFYKNSELVEV